MCLLDKSLSTRKRDFQYDETSVFDKRNATVSVTSVQ